MITGGTKWNQRDFSKGLAENVGFIFFTILFLEVNLKLLKKKKEKVTDQMLFFFITVKQFSPGSFLKAPRKHVPALL